MSKFWDDYYLPKSAQEALDLLGRYDGRARVIAGGTDLLLDMQEAHHAGARPHVDALVDVTRMQGADALREEDGWLVVGCGVTHAQVVASPLVQERATALAEACGVVGGPQVRNVATLGGNIAHALPAADGLIALLVLNAQALVQSTKAERSGWMPIASLYLGPGQSTVDPTRELIAAIRFRPTGECEASAFGRVMRPQGVALPILGMAARIQLKAEDGGWQIEDTAISAGPVSRLPFRAVGTEDFLHGQRWDDRILAEASQVLLNEVSPRTSPHRATKEYRLELLPALLRQVLTRAQARAVGAMSQ